MNRIAQIALLSFAAVAAAGVGGYYVGRSPQHRESGQGSSNVATMAAEPTGSVIYYRHPEGKLLYSAAAQQTADGRSYLPVKASEDISFDDKPAHSGDHGASKSEKRILYYRNPMGLADTSPVPKKDSMGMDYVPVYDGEQDEAGIVKVSAGKRQRTGVKTDIAEKRVLTRQVRVPGTVQLDERRITVVATRSDAFVEEVANVTTGDRVTAGQALVKLYSPEIAAAGAQLVSDLNSPGRNMTFSGSRQRLENLGVSDATISEIERTKKAPVSITWSSPQNGIVLERNVTNGMKMSPGDVLFRIADLSTVWVLADVPEYELGAVKIGDHVSVRIRSNLGQVFTGRVDSIYPQINKETRTTRIRIELLNTDNALLPDMYADVEIATSRTEAVITVPDSAVVDTGTRQVVILDKNDGRFEPRVVKTGSRGNGFYEILEGVREGDKIVVSANFLIDAESNLNAALSGMTSPEDHQ